MKRDTAPDRASAKYIFSNLVDKASGGSKFSPYDISCISSSDTFDINLGVS